MMQENEIVYQATTIEETSPEVVSVEIFEAFQAPVASDEFNHALLTNREIHDAHPITAITGLREELNSIEALQTIYSDKKGNADYYEWADGNYGADDRTGLFVTLDNEVRTISICTGDDIFGVVVDGAGFVGGQDKVARDARYGLVATTGAIHVRCERNVRDGDYVVSNGYGVARTSRSGHGYKVVALHNIDGIPYATIKLNISADQVDSMGAEIQILDSRMDTAETNIVSAINVANEAYKKSTEAATSSSVSEEAVKEALESILGAGQKIEDFERVVESTSVAAAQAKAMADSVAITAQTMSESAVKRIDEDWKKTNDVINTLEPIASWKDDETGISGADYLADVMEEGIATTYDIKTVDDKTEKAMSAIIRNGKELQSLMTVIDKYSVGPYSQAYGFTLEQAASVLEEGMIYVPTSHEDLDAGTKYHEEKYSYTDENGDAQIATRSFVPGYLYKWGQLDNGLYGWITVDKNYESTTEIAANETNSINISAMAVYFSHVEVTIGKDNNYGYWYTNADEIVDKNGNVGTYEPYTLYKWEKPEDEDGYWFAVATLAGNSLSRATSQIRQTATSIEASVTNLQGSYAGIRSELDTNKSAVTSLADWKNGKDSNKAIIRQESSDGQASIVIAALLEEENDDGTTKTEDMASLVLNVIKDSNGNPTSVLAIGADNIDLNGVVTANGTFQIDTDGTMIATGGQIGGWTLDETSLETTDYTLEATPNVSNCSQGQNGYFHLGTEDFSNNVSVGGTIGIKRKDWRLLVGSNFGVAADGHLVCTSGRIGNWNINGDELYSIYGDEYTGINTSVYNNHQVNGSPVRFYAGGTSAKIDSPFIVTADGSLYASRGDFGGLKINDLSLTIDNEDAGGSLQLYHTGMPRLSVFKEVNNQPYGSVYDASGVTIQKWSTNDFSGGGWLTLYNNNTVYSLYLDHTDNTVKFTTTSLLLTFYINGYKLQSTTAQSMTWQEWVNSNDNGDNNFTTLCINGNERYIGISGAPARIRLKKADGTYVVATDAIIANHRYTFGS